jgi:hypothetical protein
MFNAIKHSYGITKLTKNKEKPRTKEFVYFNFKLQKELF